MRPAEEQSRQSDAYRPKAARRSVLRGGLQLAAAAAAGLVVDQPVVNAQAVEQAPINVVSHQAAEPAIQATNDAGGTALVARGTGGGGAIGADIQGVTTAVQARGAVRGIVATGAAVGVEARGAGAGVTARADAGVGVIATGGAVGLQASGTRFGATVESTGSGATGLQVRGGAAGIDVQASAYGITSSGPASGVVGRGGTGVEGIGTNIGVSARGQNAGVVATGATGIRAEGTRVGVWAMAHQADPTALALRVSGRIEIRGNSRGRLTLPAGTTTLQVHGIGITTESMVLLTPRSNPRAVLWIDAIGDGHFTIGVFPAPLTADTIVDYLVI